MFKLQIDGVHVATFLCGSCAPHHVSTLCVPLLLVSASNMSQQRTTCRQFRICRLPPAWTQALACLQRALLLHGAAALAEKRVATHTRPLAAVVFVATGSDDTASTVQTLRDCARLLAPCTPAGWKALQQRHQQARTLKQTSTAKATVGRVPDDAAKQADTGLKAAVDAGRIDKHPRRRQPQGSEMGNIAQGHGTTQHPGYVLAGEAPAEWACLLDADGAMPVPVVLQAVTPSMLADMTPGSVRSTAFALHTKLSTRLHAHASHSGGGTLNCVPATAPDSMAKVARDPHSTGAVTAQLCLPAFKLLAAQLPLCATQVELGEPSAVQHDEHATEGTEAMHAVGAVPLSHHNSSAVGKQPTSSTDVPLAALRSGSGVTTNTDSSAPPHSNTLGLEKQRRRTGSGQGAAGRHERKRRRKRRNAQEASQSLSERSSSWLSNSGYQSSVDTPVNTVAGRRSSSEPRAHEGGKAHGDGSGNAPIASNAGAQGACQSRNAASADALSPHGAGDARSRRDSFAVADVQIKHGAETPPLPGSKPAGVAAPALQQQRRQQRHATQPADASDAQPGAAGYESGEIESGEVGEGSGACDSSEPEMPPAAMQATAGAVWSSEACAAHAQLRSAAAYMHADPYGWASAFEGYGDMSLYQPAAAGVASGWPEVPNVSTRGWPGSVADLEVNHAHPDAADAADAGAAQQGLSHTADVPKTSKASRQEAETKQASLSIGNGDEDCHEQPASTRTASTAKGDMLPESRTAATHACEAHVSVSAAQAESMQGNCPASQASDVELSPGQGVPAHVQQMWHPANVLHCSYVYSAEEAEGAARLAIAWCDTCGELVQCSSRKLCISDTCKQHLAWQAAARVLQATFTLLAQCTATGAASLTHLCIALRPSMAEDAWAWLQMPALASACQLADAGLNTLQQITVVLAEAEVSSSIRGHQVRAAL